MKSIDQLYEEFVSTYGYVSISKEIVEDFCDKFRSDNVYLLYDYVLSQGLEEDIEI